MKWYALIVLLIPGLVLFSFVGVVHAQLPFGGFNIIAIPCTASPPFFLDYYFPVGAFPPNLMVPPQIPYAYYAFLVPSVPILGLYEPVAIPCLVYAGVTVITIGVGFPVLMEGTGL
jgi:hypothetical protein